MEKDFFVAGIHTSVEFFLNYSLSHRFKKMC